VGDLNIGAHFGAMFDAAGAFSGNGLCPEERTVFVGSHVGYEFLGFIEAEGGVSIHQENRPDRCINGMIPPPPENGSLRIRSLREGVRGFPYTTAEGRLSLRTPRVKDIGSARLRAGGGRILPKDIGFLLV
jgi:hypothetical protein